jgi:hypothetical protein
MVRRNRSPKHFGGIGSSSDVYTRVMRRITTPMTLAASFCLLALQLSGLHMHLDAGGYVGTPQPAHTHRQSVHAHHSLGHSHDAHDGAYRAGDVGEDPAHDSDYEGTRDITFDELALSPAKLPLALLPMIVLSIVVSRVLALPSLDVVHPVLSGRHTRWRPELRAPPKAA